MDVCNDSIVLLLAPDCDPMAFAVRGLVILGLSAFWIWMIVTYFKTRK